ncbi:MAG: hypothetical protein AABX51_02230 [Nanoarchaeota archaeon]
MNHTIEDKLRELGVFPRTIEQSADISRNASDVNYVDQRLANAASTASAEQFIFMHYMRIRERNPEVVQQAVSALKTEDISEEDIADYFTSGWDPSATFHLAKCKVYDLETRRAFTVAANQYALDQVKEYLGA